MRVSTIFAACLLVATASAVAADPALTVRAAWAPAADKGADTNLYLTVENGGAEDAIVRVRCDAANFTELRATDLGEGRPSTRIVKTIPIVAQGETALTPEAFNVRLLQLTNPLVPGDIFDCAIRLRGGSQEKVAVTVRPSDTRPE